MKQPFEIDEWGIETLQEVIQRGESNWLEFKCILEFDQASEMEMSKKEWRHKLQTEFTAFANADGGTILFGVSDEGDPIGVPKPKAGVNGFFNELIRNVNPPLTIGHHLVPLSEEGESRYVIIVNVEKSESQPVQTSRAAYYVRINEAAQRMNREMVQTMFFRSQERFDARRDLEIEFDRYLTTYRRQFMNYPTEIGNIPDFTSIRSDKLREAIRRFLRYGDFDQETRDQLRTIMGTIDDVENLRERFNTYSRGENIAFEYGRGTIANTSADYKMINNGAREGLATLTETLNEQIRQISTLGRIGNDQ